LRPSRHRARRDPHQDRPDGEPSHRHGCRSDEAAAHALRRALPGSSAAATCRRRCSRPRRPVTPTYRPANSACAVRPLWSAYPNGVTAVQRLEGSATVSTAPALALIGADGLSGRRVRARRFSERKPQPRFAGRTAWRGDGRCVAIAFDRGFREPSVCNLWLGGNAHLVALPGQGGRHADQHGGDRRRQMDPERRLE
jgi:hypothetical protein